MAKRQSAAEAAKAVELQARSKSSSARKSKAGELDRRESKAIVVKQKIT